MQLAPAQSASLIRPGLGQMKVLATGNGVARVGDDPSQITLAFGPAADDGMQPPYASADEAIAHAQAGTAGPYKGAVAIVKLADGTFQGQPIVSLPSGVTMDIERSKAKSTFVTGRMAVQTTDVVAIVDGARVEQFPDYSADMPAAWQDLPLLSIVRDDVDAFSNGGISRSVQRNQNAKLGDSHFTNVGTDYDAAIKRAQASVRRDYFKEALAVLQGVDGAYYLTGFEGNRGLLEPRDGGDAPVMALVAESPAVKAIVGASQVWEFDSSGAGAAAKA